MHRYKITIEYDGSNFAGWQKQINACSVQSNIEEAIYSFSKEQVTIYAAGRTDAGVHATGQVAHFELSRKWDTYIIERALNHFVKPHISIIKCEEVDNDFHARFSAKERWYKYIIINRNAHLALMQNRAWHLRDELDIELMQKAANFLLGKHDFTSFRTIMCQAKSPIRTINEIKIERVDEYINIYLKAPSFLHHMVRNIVGTLKFVGNGKWTPEYVEHILKACDRSIAGPTAPACGLYLTNVIY
ncbi:MAG: tRNA pseudouridine(38-40) synthase TruA [Alphaproteobacteria bacterium]